MTTEESGAVRRERLDGDDHDLLTFTEAGERLRVELAAARARISALEASGDTQACQEARERLAALENAAQRHASRAINDENFERFFGYRGSPRGLSAD